MRRFALLFVLSAFVFFSRPVQSEAGFHSSLSLGGNYSFMMKTNGNDAERIGLNLEGILAYRIPFLSADLGVFYDFLKQDFQLRPGIKVLLGWFYLRVAIPLAFDFKFQPDNMFNMGVMLGAGLEFKIKKFAILLEANVSPFFLRVDINDRGGGVILPGELRLGVAYNF